MLILTRKSGESINIGPSIVVRVLEIKGNQARIGIEAPRQIAVHREEVYRQVQKRNEQAASGTPLSLGGVTKLWAQKGARPRPTIAPAGDSSPAPSGRSTDASSTEGDKE